MHGTRSRTLDQPLAALLEPQLVRRPGLRSDCELDRGGAIADQHPIQQCLPEQLVSRTNDLLLATPQRLFDSRMFGQDRRPAQQIDLVDLETQRSVH